MSNHKSLIFFNNSGDSLNFNYNDSSNRFEGNILFDENSTDTFKTQGLYMFEKVPSFEFESPGNLSLDKFQLFNEFGINLYGTLNGSMSVSQKIDLIEPVNDDPNYFSKWIYGVNFDSKYKIGTHLLFDSPIMEFGLTNSVYVVVSSKKNAVMVLSTMDNSTFETNYSPTYSNTSTYNSAYISGINTIGVYNYTNLSSWSEPNFYTKYYNGKVLNIVNSDKNKNADRRFNQKVVTISNSTLNDTEHYEYSVTASSVPTNSNIIIELITRMDLPLVYSGQLNITNNNIDFNGVVYPKILKPNTQFKINGSVNTLSYTVAPVDNFKGNNKYMYYATQSLAMWNNIIYECVKGYTQSGNDPGNSEYWTSHLGISSGYEIDPDNTVYWKQSTFIPVVETLTPESPSNAQIYLLTDTIYFEQAYTQSSVVTLASAAEAYADQFKAFNIDLSFSDNILNASLMYPTKYAEVNVYENIVGPTYSISTVLPKFERIVGVNQELITELNYNLSERKDYNIVFTDLDEYGLIVTINNMVYQEEIDWVYSGITVDMDRTIDRTLRNWISRNYVELLSLGIIASLQYIGSPISVFYNSIRLKTEYPNIPLVFNVVVGTTANFYIEHSTVLFNDLGGYLGVTINNRDYSISSTFSGTSSVANIPATLQLWYAEYGDILKEYGIYVSIINSLIKFDVKKQDTVLQYSFTIGKSTLPGLPGYTIINKIKGNEGLIIASNETRLSGTSSIENFGFSTGMVYSVNNTVYVFDNQEYLIQALNPGGYNGINMSYEGPFWGVTSGSSSIIPLPPSGGPFNMLMFSASQFSLSFNPNTYNTYTQSVVGNNNLVDISYIQLSSSIYAFGDNITVLDAYLAFYLTTISLPGNTQSIKLEFNPVNSYLYALSAYSLYIIDPLINTVISSMTFSYGASDSVVNTNNGDIYISHGTASSQLDIFDISNTPHSISLGVTGSFNMVYNAFENDIYVTTDSDMVIRIDGATRTIQATYSIPGYSVDHTIYYEPVNESVYVWGSASLYKIDNNVIVPISSISTQTFNDILFDNITGNMYVSRATDDFIKLDLNSNNIIDLSAVNNYGFIEINQYDGDIYLSSQNHLNVLIINPVNMLVKQVVPMSGITKRLIFDPERNSMWTVSSSEIVEIKVTSGSYLTPTTIISQSIGVLQYGTLGTNYVPRPDIWLKTREYIRKPRENFSDDVRAKYYYRWLTDNIPEMFLYDFSGDQLSTTGSYSYAGVKPLNNIVLNKVPNRDLNKISSPEAQQTIFDRLYYTLEYIDEVATNIYLDPEPLESFIGFNSLEEGSLRSVLQLFKREDIMFEISSTNINNEIVSFTTIIDNFGNKSGQITMNTMSSELFVTDISDNKRGLKPGQLIRIDINDKTNTKKQYISRNTGRIFKIREVYNRTIIVDFLKPGDYLYDDTTVISDYPKVGSTTYLGVRFTIIDIEIGRFNIIGQTEEEDERFKIELGNTGKNIGSDEVFIFKEYDINEGGSDWTYLNKKRKEMLMNRHLIYPYIGSYKSIINAINFFGYNDLEFYEYYRNINDMSVNFGQLFKVEIPDIFDNTVPGWTENDFIKHTLPNASFEVTNLFNLTFNITDKQGNNVLLYTLSEVQTKLQGLKYWLQRNIIPLTHKILDITGRADFVGTNTIQHKSYDISIFNIKQNMSPVFFKLNEAYLMPVNSGSTQYNCVLDFYTLITASYSSNLSSFAVPSTASLPDNYNISIKTYKTYPEWAPFVTYNIGDRVIYYETLYESVIDNNKINNPRKYENYVTWGYPDNLTTFSYVVGQVYEYNRDFYVYSGIASGTSSTFSVVPPSKDPGNWLDVTDWRQIDLDPVQKIGEYRQISNINPFNFTIDSNIDPFLVIEVTSDNGYGQVYRDKKNYEIRGLLDLRDPVTNLDPIGPFVAISPIL